MVLDKTESKVPSSHKILLCSTSYLNWTISGFWFFFPHLITVNLQSREIILVINTAYSLHVSLMLMCSSDFLYEE